MKDSEQRKAARAFVQDWTGRGDEKQAAELRRETLAREGF